MTFLHSAPLYFQQGVEPTDYLVRMLVFGFNVNHDEISWEYEFTLQAGTPIATGDAISFVTDALAWQLANALKDALESAVGTLSEPTQISVTKREAVETSVSEPA